MMYSRPPEVCLSSNIWGPDLFNNSWTPWNMTSPQQNQVRIDDLDLLKKKLAGLLYVVLDIYMIGLCAACNLPYICKIDPSQELVCFFLHLFITLLNFAIFWESIQGLSDYLNALAIPLALICFSLSILTFCLGRRTFDLDWGGSYHPLKMTY